MSDFNNRGANITLSAGKLCVPVQLYSEYTRADLATPRRAMTC